MIRFLFVITCLLSAAPALLAQSNDDAERQARAALFEFLDAWNTGDIDNVRQMLNYPHVTHGPNGLIIANDAEAFVQDFDLLRSQGWGSSSFDAVRIYQASPNKVNMGVDFSRLNAEGDVYSRGVVFYVFTDQDGKWGMQYRAGVPRLGQWNDAELEQARIEATAAVIDFFNGFNAADNEALYQVHHVPQAVLVPNDNAFIYAENQNSPAVTTNFTGMRRNEDWDHSVFRDLTARSVAPTRVIFELVFERINSKDTVYRRTPAMWVLTKREGRWGVEFRSLMESTMRDEN